MYQRRIRLVLEVLTCAVIAIAFLGDAWQLLHTPGAPRYPMGVALDLGTGFGGLLCVILGIPVALGSIVQRRTGRSLWLAEFATLATVVLGAVAIFSSDSSTAAIGLLFLPFYAFAAFFVGASAQVLGWWFQVAFRPDPTEA